jgi:hypothetical protein
MRLINHSLVRRAAIFAAPLIVVAAIVVALAGNSGASAARQLPTGRLTAGLPAVATATQLSYYQHTVRHPVYWIGPYSGYRYELTETAKHDTYIRYLPVGAKVGDRRAAFTTIGTYPAANAYQALLTQAKGANMTTKVVSYNGIAVWSAKHPTSVYLAYPKLAYLIEVYDATPQHAQAIAESGKIRPVG